MRLDDLTAAEQRQIRAGNANRSARGASAPLSARRPTSPNGNIAPARKAAPRAELYQCHHCGDTFTAWAPAERHADQPGHRRINWLGGKA